jgi:hypothetical protein
MSELSVVARRGGGRYRVVRYSVCDLIRGADDKGDPEPLLVPHARLCQASIRVAGLHAYRIKEKLGPTFLLFTRRLLSGRNFCGRQQQEGTDSQAFGEATSKNHAISPSRNPLLVWTRPNDDDCDTYWETWASLPHQCSVDLTQRSFPGMLTREVRRQVWQTQFICSAEMGFSK